MSISDKLKKVKALLSSVKLSQEPLVDGTLIEYSGDAISANEVVYKVEGADNINVLPDGAYITKSQTNFTITAGVVSAVTAKAATAPTSTTAPVLQAQSSQTEENKDDSPEKKEEKVELADATVTVDIATVISQALSPVWDAIYAIQRSLENLATLYVSQDMFSKVQTEFSKTKNAVNELADTVGILAKEPASIVTVEKEVTSFSANQKKAVRENRESETYKIFNS